MSESPTNEPRPDIYARVRRFAPAIVVLFCVGVLVLVAFVRPFESPAPDISIDRPMVGIGFDPTGAYMIIHDAGGKDRLLSASSPVARSITFQTFTVDGATTTTVDALDPTTATELVSPAVASDVDSFEIDGFSDLRLVPGSAQLLLQGLTAPLVEGQIVPITLVFERAGALTVDAVAASYNDIADRLLPPRLVTQ